jgi:hypothetical protein
MITDAPSTDLPEKLTTLPPCVPCEEAGWTRSFVARIKCASEYDATVLEGLWDFGKQQIRNHGLCMFAILKCTDDRIYFALTDKKHDAKRRDNGGRHWRTELRKVSCLVGGDTQKLCEFATIEEVTAFTRRLQRFFGFGDVKAVQEEPPQEPPQLMLQNGCEHVYRETEQLCGLCFEHPLFVCECGAARLCLKHWSPEPQKPTTWMFWCHGNKPAPFFVTDEKKMEIGDYSLWMRHELGTGADLETFASTFLEFFGDKIRGNVQQKKKCIELFSEYAPEIAKDWKMECQLPPEYLEQFKRAWEPEVGTLCRDCTKPVSESGSLFCSQECANKGKKIICRTCGKTGIEGLDGLRMCLKCRPPKLDTPQSGFLAESIKRGEALLKRIYSDTGFKQTQDTDYEPTWKKRKRS